MRKKKITYIIYDNLKTLTGALIIAILIRSLLFQPFYIPSSSMEPTLLVGDRIFVSKYTYGYSKHSFPFSPPILNKRIMFSSPKRGDVIVFKTPADNRTDYIKRLIGLPGDTIQFINGEIYLNNNQIFKNRIFEKSPARGDIVVFKTPYDNRTDYIKRLIGLPGDTIQFIDGNIYINNNQVLTTLINNKEVLYCGSQKINVSTFVEKLPNNKSYVVSYRNDASYQNSDKYIVPDNHYFFLGDNRDCSKDSRFLSDVGYVHKDNLVGKAQILFFSTKSREGSIFQIWKWPNIIRYERFFKKLN